MVEAPDILYNETSNDTIVAEGASVTLRCEARGYPEPIVTWRREDGAPIVLRNHKNPARSKLQIVCCMLSNYLKITQMILDYNALWNFLC